ncbi:hypothetical protein ABK040_008655 [Willaertia magna]
MSFEVNYAAVDEQTTNTNNNHANANYSSNNNNNNNNNSTILPSSSFLNKPPKLDLIKREKEAFRKLLLNESNTTIHYSQHNNSNPTSLTNPLRWINDISSSPLTTTTTTITNPSNLRVVNHNHNKTTMKQRSQSNLSNYNNYSNEQYAYSSPKPSPIKKNRPRTAPITQQHPNTSNNNSDNNGATTSTKKLNNNTKQEPIMNITTTKEKRRANSARFKTNHLIYEAKRDSENQLNSSIYVPNHYEKIVNLKLLNILNSNQYITINRINELLPYKSFKNNSYIPYLVSINHQLNLINLNENIIIKKELLDQLQLFIDITINGNNDKNISLPLYLDNNGMDIFSNNVDNIKLLIEKYCNQNIYIFGNRYILSQFYIDQLDSDFYQLALQKVQLNTTINTTNKDNNTINNKEEEEEEEEEVISNRKAKKGNARKVNKKGSNSNSSNNNKQVKKEDSFKKILPKKDEIYNMIEKQLLKYLIDKNNENMIDKYNTQDEDIINELIDFYLLRINNIYLKVKEELINNQLNKNIVMNEVNDKEFNLNDKMNDLYSQLCLHCKSLTYLDNLNNLNLFEKHLLKTKGVLLTYLVIVDTCKNYISNQLNINSKNILFINKEFNTLLNIEDYNNQFIEINRELKLLLKQLNTKMELEKSKEEEMKQINLLMDTLNGNNLNLFLEQFDKTSKELNLFIKILDKKREKNYLKEIKLNFKNYYNNYLIKLDDQLDIKLLGIINYLLLNNNILDKYIYLYINGKFIKDIIRSLELNKNCNEMIQNLFNCQQLIIEYLNMKRNNQLFTKEVELKNLIQLLEKQVGLLD